MSSGALERWKSISAIASSVAIPVVLAVVGYFVQRQLAEQGLRKDYVQIAVTILKEDPSKQDADLRQWAVQLVDENSPLPLTDKVKDRLKTMSIISALGQSTLDLAAMFCDSEKSAMYEAFKTKNLNAYDRALLDFKTCLETNRRDLQELSTRSDSSNRPK